MAIVCAEKERRLAREKTLMELERVKATGDGSIKREGLREPQSDTPWWGREQKWKRRHWICPLESNQGALVFADQHEFPECGAEELLNLLRNH